MTPSSDKNSITLSFLITTLPISIRMLTSRTLTDKTGLGVDIHR